MSLILMIHWFTQFNVYQFYPIGSEVDTSHHVTNIRRKQRLHMRSFVGVLTLGGYKQIFSFSAESAMHICIALDRAMH